MSLCHYDHKKHETMSKSDVQNSCIPTLLKIFAGLGLLLTILPSILVFSGAIYFKLHLVLMAIGMVLWFGARIGLQYLEAETE